MNDNRRSPSLFFLTLSSFSAFLIGAALLRAQPVQEITANPEAKPLRQIWTVYGGDTIGGARVGLGIGSVGDVNSDGLMDFAVNWGAAGEWRIFYGNRDSISHTASQVFKRYGTVPYHPVVGDFWGTGHKAVGFPTGTFDTSNIDKFYYQLHLFRTDSNRIASLPSAILDVRKMNPKVRFSPVEILGADLDGDGADELIIFLPGVFRDDVPYPNPEIWIYRGGPNFQVDTPTVVIRDSEVNGGNGRQVLFVGHWDNDQYMDLATSSDYEDGVQKLKFYFGGPGSPWNWMTPGKVIPFGGLVALDCDGDGVLDIAAPESRDIMDLFLSRDKSIHDRDLTKSDVDRRLSKPTFYHPLRLGYIGDSLHRYEMLGIIGEGAVIGLNGGADGPDSLFDVSYSGDDTFGAVEPLGDVDGDGWPELLTAYSGFGLNSGIATLFAGGPYIPHEPPAEVREIAIAGKPAAVSTWPNPMRDELHIAWRGDLPHRPEHFRVHDLLGTLVAEGHVDPWRGEALWRCAGNPPGTYLLSIFDHDGRLLATAYLIKE